MLGFARETRSAPGGTVPGNLAECGPALRRTSFECGIQVFRADPKTSFSFQVLRPSGTLIEALDNVLMAKMGPEPAVAADQAYELLDFGEGRKLERFGQFVLDRPCPSASGLERRNVASWSLADARYHRTSKDAGRWEGRLPDPWTIALSFGCLQLWPAPFGHIGIFPEQLANWHWLHGLIRSSRDAIRVLNLFAYTGGSTLAAAQAGARVTHVDSAGNIVTRARANAAASQLAEHPIRWITEDAVKFCGREVRRGNHYDAIILDPPSYGRGPRGQVWRFDRDFPTLIELCRELASEDFRFLLATCHTTGIEPGELAARILEKGAIRSVSRIATGRMATSTSDGRELPAGVFVRLQRPEPR